MLRLVPSFLGAVLLFSVAPTTRAQKPAAMPAADTATGIRLYKQGVG